MNHPLLLNRSTVYTGQDLCVPSCSMLPSCLMLPSLLLLRLLCKIQELFFIKHQAKVNGQQCWDILLSQRMLHAINAQLMTILSFSKTVHQCIFRSTQSHRCSTKLSTSSLLSYGAVGCNSPELNSTDYKIQGVMKQHEHQLQVTRLNKLSHRLVEVRQFNSTAFE